MYFLKKILKKLGREEVIILMVIFFIAFALRIAFLDYGLPRLYFEDEEFFVEPALRIADGAFNPGWFQAPAQPLIYGLGFVFRGLNFIINRINDTLLVASANYQVYVSAFQAAGRTITAIFGSLLVIAVYYLGKAWNRRTGYLSAIFVALSFYLIDHSYIIRPDIMQAFFLILTLVFASRIIDQPEKTKFYILSGTSLGIAFTMKYPSLVFLVPLMFVFVWLWKKGKLLLKKWFYLGLSAFAASFIFGPFLYLDFPSVVISIIKENRASHAGHDGLGFFGNLWWYITHSLNWQIGTLFSAVVIAVIGFFVYKVIKKRIETRELKLLVVIVAIFSYLLFLSMLNLHWERWMIPVLVMTFVLGAVGIDYILKRFQKNILVVVLLFVLVFAAPFFRLIRTVYSLASDHTIETARTYVLENIPEGSGIVQEPYTPNLPESRYRIYKVGNLTYHNWDYYKDENFDFFIISGDVYGRIVQQAGRWDPEGNFTRASKNYEQIFAKSSIVHEIYPNKNYTASELLYSNDFTVLKTLNLDLKKGSYVKIYKF